MENCLCLVAVVLGRSTNRLMAEDNVAPPRARMTLKIIVYKTVGDAELKMKVRYPQDWKAGGEKLPALLLFHGGGWNGGDLNHLWRQAHQLALRGMITITPGDRTRSVHDVGPDKCLEDAKSAMRYVRSHAEELGIDETRIAAGGGSAGGHLAAALAFTVGFNAADDDLSVGTRTEALLLLNPVIDNGPGGFGHDMVKD